MTDVKEVALSSEVLNVTGPLPVTNDIDIVSLDEHKTIIPPVKADGSLDKAQMAFTSLLMIINKGSELDDSHLTSLGNIDNQEMLFKLRKKVKDGIRY